MVQANTVQHAGLYINTISITVFVLFKIYFIFKNVSVLINVSHIKYM